MKPYTDNKNPTPFIFYVLNAAMSAGLCNLCQCEYNLVKGKIALWTASRTFLLKLSGAKQALWEQIKVQPVFLYQWCSEKEHFIGDAIAIECYSFSSGSLESKLNHQCYYLYVFSWSKYILIG